MKQSREKVKEKCKYGGWKERRMEEAKKEMRGRRYHKGFREESKKTMEEEKKGIRKGREN